MKQVKKCLALGICMMMSLALWGCSSNPAAQEETQQTEAKSTSYAVGETAEKSGVKMTFKGATEAAGNTYIKPADGKTFILCEFEIENTSSNTVNISSALSFSAYVDGVQTSVSLSALSADNSKSQLDGEISTGKKMIGVVGYEVPAAWSEIEIEFKPDVLSSDKLVFKATK